MSSLLLPIIVGDKGIGLIVLDNFNTVAAFKAEDEALMLALSQQAALSLENVRLVNAMTERAGQLQGLNEVATAVASSLRSDQLWWRSVGSGRQHPAVRYRYALDA